MKWRIFNKICLMKQDNHHPRKRPKKYRNNIFKNNKKNKLIPKKKLKNKLRMCKLKSKNKIKMYKVMFKVRRKKEIEN